MRAKPYEKAECLACGKEFLRLAGMSKPQKYCCRSCIPRKRFYEQAVCEGCGAEFTRQARTSNPQRFCSNVCLEKRRKQLADEARIPAAPLRVERAAFVFGGQGSQPREADFWLGF